MKGFSRTNLLYMRLFAETYADEQFVQQVVGQIPWGHNVFLTLDAEAHERDLERGLIDNIRKFLLELGVGFSFVGSQYHLEVGGQDFYLDLLLYHLRLRAFVVIDLK